MITGVSPPTAGEIRVLDKNLATDARDIKAVLGVVPQIDNLDVDLTVLNNLMTFARYFDIPKPEARRRSLEILRLFQLEDKMNNRLDELSGGMKRRLLIGRSLINNPKIIVLDEPTIGLDPQGKYLVWRKLTELKSKGITQLLCTQNMEEASVLCDRVAIMNLGKFLCLESPQSLINQYVGDEIVEASIPQQEKEKFISFLKNHHFEFEELGDKVEIFNLKKEIDLAGMIDSSIKLKRRSTTLEDVFIKLTGRSLNE